MSTVSLNVFRPVEVKGDVKNKNYGFRIDGKVYTSETGTLVPGTAVKLVDTSGDNLDFAVAAADDDIFGIVEYEAAKKNSYVADDFLTVASQGSIIVLEASTGIARGANVEYVASGAKVKTHSTGKSIGKALTKATTSGDLIKVLLLVPSVYSDVSST